MPSALVTGVTGQDGGFLVERLAADGYTVHGLVRGGEDLTDLQRRCPDAVLHEGELSDSAALAEALARSGADEVYHLAGISSVALSWEEPLLTAEVTALASARLLDLAWQHQERRGRPVRYLQASSAEIFGQADEAPQDERTPVRPTSPYGAAKAFAHHLTGVYRTRGMFAVSLVLYNHESDRRPASFVTRKITQGAARIALGTQQELVLGNLDVRRDWGWAPDYVDAMVRAVRHERADDYVIATGAAHSVADFVAAAFDRAGVEEPARRRVRVDPALFRPADAGLQVGDASKAKRELGWSPSVAFSELVGRMVDADLAQLRSAARAPEPS
ncbi:MAG: GDP-mannose 4,6-dehydratase [Mycobacteriales bacterium]